MNQSTSVKIQSEKISYLDSYFFSLNHIQLKLNPNRKEKGYTVHAIKGQMDGFGLRLDFSIWSKSMIPNRNLVAYHYILLKIKNEIYWS